MIKRFQFIFLTLFGIVFYQEYPSSDRKQEKKATKSLDENLWREIIENYPDTQSFSDVNSKKFNGPLSHLNFLKPRKIHEKGANIHTPEGCEADQSSFVFLIAIKSLPASRTRRDIIRKTWGDEQYWSKVGRHIPKNIKLKRIFLLGESGNKNLQNEINEESLKFGDILQSTFQEHLYTLTYNHGF